MLIALLGSLAPHEKGLQHWTQHQPLLTWWWWELRHLKFFLSWIYPAMPFCVFICCRPCVHTCWDSEFRRHIHEIEIMPCLSAGSKSLTGSNPAWFAQMQQCRLRNPGLQHPRLSVTSPQDLSCLNSTEKQIQSLSSKLKLYALTYQWWK